MKAKIHFPVVVIAILFCMSSFAQDTNNTKIIFEEIPLNRKHRFATWRVDYYICTGIAYAKSMGQSVEDFAEFVGKHHELTYPNDQTLSGVAQTSNQVMTNYPGGQYEIISESDSVIIAKSNRPYKRYYKNGPLLGVTIDEFEKYLWGHVTIMANKININFQYEIKEDEIIYTVSYKE